MRRIAEFPLRGWTEVISGSQPIALFRLSSPTRIGLPATVSEALSQSYERWDGKGVPNGVEGE